MENRVGTQHRPKRESDAKEKAALKRENKDLKKQNARLRKQLQKMMYNAEVLEIDSQEEIKSLGYESQTACEVCESKNVVEIGVLVVCKACGAKKRKKT